MTLGLSTDPKSLHVLDCDSESLEKSKRLDRRGLKEGHTQCNHVPLQLEFLGELTGGVICRPENSSMCFSCANRQDSGFMWKSPARFLSYTLSDRKYEHTGFILCSRK